MKVTGKLPDGTVFTQKGHAEEPYEFKVDEGNDILSGTIFSFCEGKIIHFELNDKKLDVLQNKLLMVLIEL